MGVCTWEHVGVRGQHPEGVRSLLHPLGPKNLPSSTEPSPQPWWRFSRKENHADGVKAGDLIGSVTNALCFLLLYSDDTFIVGKRSESSTRVLFREYPLESFSPSLHCGKSLKSDQQAQGTLQKRGRRDVGAVEWGGCCGMLSFGRGMDAALINPQ